MSGCMAPRKPGVATVPGQSPEIREGHLGSNRLTIPGCTVTSHAKGLKILWGAGGGDDPIPVAATYPGPAAGNARFLRP
jgi:hypothetical protein